MINYKHLFKPTSAHVLIISFLLGGMGGLVIGVQDSLQKAETNMLQSLKVVVFIAPTVSESAAKTWADGLASQDPAIESVTFISKQEALDKAQGNPGLVKSLMLLRENPLPASVVLHYRDVAWLERPEPAITLNGVPEVQEMRWDPEARSIFRMLHGWRVWLARISFFAMVLMGVWCSFGMYRFLALRAKTKDLMLQLGLGVTGGALALLFIAFALKKVGPEASIYLPVLNSPWPIVAGMMSALATFGWKVSDEY